MSFTYNGFPQGFQQQPYNGRSYVANGFTPQMHRQPRKKSGCKKGVGKNQAEYISGWNKSKSRGFISFIASPHKKKAKTKNKDYETWMVKVTQGITVQWFNAFYRISTGVLTIPDLSMVANPSKNYFGTYLKK